MIEKMPAARPQRLEKGDVRDPSATYDLQI